MKKTIIFTLITLFFVFPLASCSTDFSGIVNEKLDSLYEAVISVAEPYLKQDDKYSSNSSTNTKTDTDTNEVPVTPPTEPSEPTEPSKPTEPSEPAEPSIPSAPNVPIGTKEGEKLPSFEVQIFDESGLLDEYIDPTKEDKVTVINFWGTWCHFCVEELPEFSEVATEYKDSVTMVAIHTLDCFNEAPDYVNKNYKDSDIIFAVEKDLDGDGYDDIFSFCGGKIGYPYTIILDKNGVITYSGAGALTKEALVSAINNAQGS